MTSFRRTQNLTWLTWTVKKCLLTATPEQIIMKKLKNEMIFKLQLEYFIVNQLGNFYGRRKSNKKSESLGLLASRQLSCFGGTHEPRRPHSQAGSLRRPGRVVSPLLSFRGRRPYTCKRDVWPKVKPTLYTHIQQFGGRLL